MLSDLTGNTSYYVRLWLQDTGGNISTGSNVAQLYVPPNPPTSLTFGTISSSTLAIAWAAGNNSAPITYGVWVDTDTAESIVAASPFKAAGDLAYSFAGLTPNTTYSIYGQAKNPDTGAVSSQTVLGSTVTYAARPGVLLSSSVFLSSITVSWASGGNPEGTDYLVQLSTASDWSALSAETPWTKATMVTFDGLKENTAYYVRVKARNFAGVGSNFSGLGLLKTGLSDVLPPVTAVSFGGPSFGLEPVYVSSLTEIGLAAYDDAISSGDRMGTVVDIHYAVDADTFSVYAGSFSIADGGAHVVRYFGLDTAGNTEAVTTSSITVDNIAPATMFDVQGSSLIINSNLYVAAAASVTITAADAMSGVRAIYYTLNGSTAVAVSPLLLPATAGGHVLAFYSVDNVGNVGLENSATYYVDLAAPVSSITLTGVLKDGYYADSVTIALAASDVGTGVLGIYYSVDAEFSTTTARTYTAPFILGVGTHSVTYTATDYVGNQASMTVVDVNVATSTDITVIMPLSGPIGIPFVIAGTDFGAYSSGITKVLIGGTTAPLTLWSTTTIKGTVPGTLAAGEHTVVVMRGTTTITDVAPFTITVPVAETVTPSSGPIGMPFVISGISFGNYEAGKTQVLLGGTTCPLTLWTDTQIKGAVPGSLAAGDYGFVVERNINGGVVDTSTLPFKVIAPVLDSIAPSTASIGVGFTLTGSGFGNYVAGYTRVLMGGTTTPLTLWTDNVIKGTVPGTLTSGTYEVAVEREFNNSIVRTSTVAFTLVQPEAQAVTPSSGAIGVTFTITGVNFGNYVANYTKVLIGGTTAPVSLWSDTKIQGAVPGSLAAGDYDLVVERSINGGDVTTAPLAFKVVVPELYDLSPASGAIGVPFTLSGANFGNYSANYTRVLINGTTTPLALWTDVNLQGTIPGSLANGVYPLQVERRTADGGLVQTSTFSFEVVGITISSMSPISGPIGQVFTIYGGNFGNYSAGYTKVLMGGTTTLVSLWTDAKIQGTVPGNLTDGDYPVIVERTLNGGVVQSSSLTFTVASPVMYGLSPSSGPIGLPFTITGLNFGNYSAGYTKVLIGGATAPLTLWTDTKVQGTIPGALAAGDHELYLERALNGGVVRTSTAVFTVGAPYLDSVNPSTVSVQAVYTLAGYNFGNYSAGYTKVLVNGSTTTLTLWTDTKIQGKLPYLLAGTYPVQVQRALNGGLSESATAYVTVVEPVISSMTPVSGLARATINLYGSGFGAYESGFTKLLMDGTTCAISLWNDTRITGTVPTALAYGTHTVVAARGIAYSNGADFLLTAYTASMLKAITALGEFVLGEVYVYPNPAKGGVVPIFHIECGTADSVKIEVYTISGQAVHEYTITGAPQLITDSGGSSYAYEYAWRGHIASGVYLYRIEAERSGRKLKKTGKFAVVR